LVSQAAKSLQKVTKQRDQSQALIDAASASLAAAEKKMREKRKLHLKSETALQARVAELEADLAAAQSERKLTGAQVAAVSLELQTAAAAAAAQVQRP
jgi:hypothetical protein